jgi:hypothetical protein
MKPGMATELVSAACFVNPSHQSVCLYVYPSCRCKATVRLSVTLLSVLGNGSINTFPRQRIHGTIEELLDSSFSMRSMSYQRRIYGSVYPLSLLDNSVKTFPGQRRVVGGGFFYSVRVVSKESRRLVLPRTSCFIIVQISDSYVHTYIRGGPNCWSLHREDPYVLGTATDFLGTGKSVLVLLRNLWFA